jgi:hypothetical protein
MMQNLYVKHSTTEMSLEGFDLHSDVFTSIGNGTSCKHASANLQRLIRKGEQSDFDMVYAFILSETISNISPK